MNHIVFKASKVPGSVRLELMQSIAFVRGYIVLKAPDS